MEEWKSRMLEAEAMQQRMIASQTAIPFYIGLAFVVCLPLALGILILSLH